MNVTLKQEEKLVKLDEKQKERETNVEKCVKPAARVNEKRATAAFYLFLIEAI